MRQFLENLIRQERFDAAVVDHLAPMSYFPDRGHALLFQHNVEFMIWRRYAQHAPDPLRRLYCRIQADRMFEFERQACRESGHVVACSEVDARVMSESFAIPRISHVPTGVNLDFFARPQAAPPVTSEPDFCFIGSMDWLPNQQAVLWFYREILPLIRKGRPQATFAVVGRIPPPAISELAIRDSLLTVTGTVPDVRPWFWESAVAVVPLLAGSGTRLKIYEAMAARVPVVSTTVGAEGLDYVAGETIRIADTPEDFAAHCLDLIANPGERQRLADAAWERVHACLSWENAARKFDAILQTGPRLR
jgi:glycosyltransferase involved in cell wall biosynthesis